MTIPNLPPKENCPTIIETIQKPKQNWAQFINCFDAPELPKRVIAVTLSGQAASATGTASVSPSISPSPSPSPSPSSEV